MRWVGAFAEVLYDRLRTAVIGEDAAGVVTYSDSLVALLTHCGSAPRVYQSYRAKTKDKLERPIRYMRQDSFLRLSFREVDDLNAQFDELRTTIAHLRVHATTKRAVDEHSAVEHPHHCSACPAPGHGPDRRA
jgi:transposase